MAAINSKSNTALRQLGFCLIELLSTIQNSTGLPVQFVYTTEFNEYFEDHGSTNLYYNQVNRASAQRQFSAADNKGN